MNNELRVGDDVIASPKTITDGYTRTSIGPTKGTVYYIHPKGRFATVEFSPHIRESFPLDEITKIHTK